TEDADALRAEIQATREELGETTEALVAKADVKGRAKDAAADAAERAKQTAADAAERAKATVKDAATQAKDSAVHAKDVVRQRFAEVPDAVREHPVPPVVVGLLGAAAIAVAIYASKRR